MFRCYVPHVAIYVSMDFFTASDNKCSHREALTNIK